MAVIPGFDTHGYPRNPAGNAYPSAHTAVVVAVVAGLWPWMRTPQRIAGAVFVVLIGFNRLYIGAHWPIDILGGAAIGVIGAAGAWSVARTWPIATSRS